MSQSGTEKLISIYHPVIEVEFYTETERLSAVSQSQTPSGKTITGDLISIQTTRSMSQDCPTFSLSLIWKNSWYTKLASNDLVVVKMQRPPETKSIVMVGLIDDIRKSLEFSSGQPQRVVQVTGRGLNKVFVNFDVGLVENLSVEFGQGWMANQLDMVGVNSCDAIKLVLNSYIGKAIKYTYGNGKEFKDYFQYQGTPHSSEILCDETSYTSYTGSLWNFIKEISNTPFNETFWEIINEKPTLIHRPTPFNQDSWDALNCTIIYDSDIVSDNTGRSDLETYTLYSVECSLFDDTSGNYYLPLWYPKFYAKYGIKQLKVTTSYQLWNDSELGIDGIKTFFEDLYNFNIKNNVFSNGQITVAGRAHYRVGERIKLESENMEYYVESVSHSFNVYGSWTTTLGVTRGITPSERFTAPWGCGEEFTPAIMNAIIAQTESGEIDWDNLPIYYSSSTAKSSGVTTYYSSGRLTWPVPSSSYITSPFGERTQPTAGAPTNHRGIDISAPLGTQIVAACGGTVIASGPASGYGNWIKINHDSTYSGMVTIYGHMKTLLVKTGDIVSAGDVIALVGNEGISTGPHLHFQVEINEVAVNPLSYFTKTSGETNPSSSDSNTIILPSGLGSVYAYMGWQCITAKSSMQYKLREQAGQNFDENGFGIIKNHYVIACTTTFGSVGDYLNAELSNGEVIPCIIGDIKNPSDSGCNKWGHQNGASVLEFVVDKDSWYGTSKHVLQYHPEWKNTTVVKITKTGSFQFK